MVCGIPQRERRRGGFSTHFESVGSMNRAILQELLRALSTGFRTRDAEGLLRLFSGSATVTYAHSKLGEKAIGPTELRGLLSELLGRAVAYSFEFPDVIFCEHSGFVWLLAEGNCTETDDDGATAVFPYRFTGVLAQEEARWRWLVLVGSEPVSAFDEDPFGDVLPVRPLGVTAR